MITPFLTVLSVGCTRREVYAALLDDSSPPCPVRTMYGVLDRHNELKERRNQQQHSPCANTGLIAEGLNQGWSWYITNIEEGITMLAYFSLYVILDIFSRYGVEWMIAPRELAILAKRLIEQRCGKQRIAQDQLISPFDRGPSMKSKSVALLLSDPGITKTMSRPHVSNGKHLYGVPVQNSQYRFEFPERFKGSMPNPMVWPFPSSVWIKKLALPQSDPSVHKIFAGGISLLLAISRNTNNP